MTGFRRSEAFGAFLGHIRPFVPEIAEMRHYERIPLPEAPAAYSPFAR